MSLGNTAALSELLSLNRLAFEPHARTRDAILEATQLFLENHIDLGPEKSAALVESLFKFGRLKLAEQVARRRQVQDIAPTAFDQLAMNYRTLNEYEFRSLEVASHKPLYPPSEPRERLRVLSFLYATPAYQQNGYTVRTHAILANTASDVIPFGRIGYPWVSNQLRNNQSSTTVKVDSIEYHHRRGDIVRQSDVFRNIGLAKHEIKKIIAEHRPDVVHAASNFTVGLPALLAARECRLPFVYEMRGIWEYTAGVGIDDWEQTERFHLERRLETFVASSADRVITLTETQKAELVERGGVSPDRVDVVPNFFESAPHVGADTEFVSGLRARLKGKVVLGYIGSIVNYEGLQDLVEVLSRDNEHLQNVVLLVVGDGPFFSHLKSQVADKALDERVIFTGRVSRVDADAAYGLVDVCVLPRIDHPVTQLVSPLKIVEILAMGKVVLASDVRAIAERVEQFGFGEIFKTGDLDDLERRLVDVTQNLKALKARYRRAKDHILKHQTWKQGAAYWDGTIRRAVEDWRTSAEKEDRPGGSLDGLRSFLPATTSIVRQSYQQLVRVARARRTSVGKLVCLHLRDRTRVLAVHSSEAGAFVLRSARETSRDGQIKWTFTTPNTAGDIFLYVKKDGFETLDPVSWRLTTQAGEPIPLRLAENRVHAVLLKQDRKQDEHLIVKSDYSQPVRFAMSIIPLNNATLDGTFQKIAFSEIIGARYKYLPVQPGENIVPLRNGVIGHVLYEFTPWQDGFRGSYNGLSRTELTYSTRTEKSYFVSLPPEKHNVLVIARLNENLIDGSVIWLKTLVTALSDNPAVNVYVISNAILVPNSITAAVFSRPNVTKIDLDLTDLREEKLAEQVTLIDRVSGGFDSIIIRGDGIARALNSRSIRRRTALYSVGLITPAQVENGKATNVEAVELMSGHNALIFQNETTRDVFLRSYPRFERNCYVIPPSVEARPSDTSATAKGANRWLVYAGKVVREYGVVELLDAFAALVEKRDYQDLRLLVLGGKFDGNDPDFQEDFLRRIEKLGALVTWIPAASPETVLNWVRRAEVVWGWRHGEFETSHFEVSTKMVEAISCGTPIILYPSPANVALLGTRYEGFTKQGNRTSETLRKLLHLGKGHFATKFRALAGQYAAKNTYATLVSDLRTPVRRRGIILAGHDFRFIEDIEGQLLADGHRVFRQFWRNHSNVANYGDHFALNEADTVHCEWCLGNAAWWSKNIPPGKRLTIRFHLQELNTEYPSQVDYSGVHKVIFVSPDVMRQAIEKFGIPPDICEVVPISVAFRPRTFSGREITARRNVLALVGYTPWRKRPDLALELFERLKRKYPNLRLVIKGHMPSSYAWMKDRHAEIAAYREFFEHFAADREIFRDVSFSPYSDNMQEFYESVGWVLSTSDFEGCHTAVAEGGIVGCLPLMLNWPGADEVYPSRYVQADLAGLVATFEKMYGQFAKESKIIQSEFSKTFTLEQVYTIWSDVLGLNTPVDVRSAASNAGGRRRRRFKIMAPPDRLRQTDQA